MTKPRLYEKARIEKDSGIWPPKHNIFGIHVSATTYDEALEAVIHAAKGKRASCISHLAVHGLIEGSKDLQFGSMLNEFEIVAPDGQPVRLALRLLHGKALPDRCYGPEFMIRVCRRAEIEGVGVFLYGSQRSVVEALRNNLIAQFPKLVIAGWEPSVFRPLTDVEDGALVCRIKESKAGVVFVGLGCPLQEKFAYAHRDTINAVQICVGAAFDFHSGNKKMAPAWMQGHSLEWLFRIWQEPRRLWRRYFVTNTIFLAKLFLQFAGLRRNTGSAGKRREEGGER